jgi:uncharacterized membrane protein YoaK (UPF0700 family)
VTARQRQTPGASDTLALGLILAAAGGGMDAYTYLARGKVFANAQTGNLVLLGVRAFEGEWARALCTLVPVCAFIAGILLTEAIKTRREALRRLHWRQLVLLIETAVLAAAAFLPGSLDALVNAGISFACAMQVAAFRAFRGNPYATTMVTGNLRSGTEHLWRYLRQRGRESLRSGLGYYAIIGSFVLGAGLGAWCTERFALRAALLPAGLLLAAALLAVGRGEEA